MKEPGFYLYVNNFITGTMMYSDEQVGAYIRLLILQFSNWDFTLDQAKRVIENWKTWDIIQVKFKTDGKGHFWNERLRHEMERRKKFSQDQSKRAKSKWNDPEKIPEPIPEPIPKTSLDIDIDIDLRTVTNDNEIWKMFITGFNEITDRKFRGDEKARRQFFARMKQGYTPEQFGLAIQNCMNDEYHQQNPKFLTPEFITRQDKLEKYLNYVPTQTQKDKAKSTFINILNQIEDEQTKEN